ncbi:MAG TPA: hypothetical protein VN709_04575 [Terriglobales bacterium]|nr:hypothetical protein [Terriglobales bacterium]
MTNACMKILALALLGCGSLGAQGVCPAQPLSAFPVGTMPDNQRFCWFSANVVTPGAIAGTLVLAGASTAWDSPSEWGKTWRGYRQRAAAYFAQTTVKTAGLSATSFALREDPRLPAEDFSTPAWDRLARALESPWIVRDGTSVRPRFGYVAASFSAGFVGYALYPASQRKLGQSLLRSGAAMAGYESLNAAAALKPELHALWHRLEHVF